MDQLFDPPLINPDLPQTGEDAFPDKWLIDIRKNTKPVICTFISVGIRSEIDQMPIPSWLLDEPIKYAGKTVTGLGFHNYTGYKGYAPVGCASLTTAFVEDIYDFWKKAKDEDRYEAEKQSLSDQISKALIKKYPHLEGKIEVIDIATPLTYERYTGSYRGSWMSLACAGEKMKSYPGYLKSIKGVYFAGQRISSPGGLPVAVFTGRQAAQMVCLQFDQIFK